MSNLNKFFWITILTSCSFLTPVVSLFYIHRGVSYSQLFILTLAIVICMFLFEVPTGIFGDIYGRKTSVVVGAILSFFCSVLLIWANSFIFFLLLMILLGIGYTFVSGSWEALIFDSLKAENKEHEMKKYMAKMNVATFLPIVLTAPIGAYIAKDLAEPQFVLILLLGIITTFLALFLTFLLKEPNIEKGKVERKNPFKILKSSFNDIKNSPVIVRLFINKTLVLIMCSHVFGIIWQPYLQESGVPIVWFGILVAVCALAIAYLSHNIDAIEKIFPSKKFLFLTALLAFIAFVLGAFIRNIYFAIAMYLIIRIVNHIRDPVFSHYINNQIESHNRATILSALSMVDSFFDIIIFIAAAFIINAGLNYVLLLSGTVVLLAIVFFRIKDEHVIIKHEGKKSQD